MDEGYSNKHVSKKSLCSKINRNKNKLYRSKQKAVKRELHFDKAKTKLNTYLYQLTSSGVQVVHYYRAKILGPIFVFVCIRKSDNLIEEWRRLS